MHAQLCRCGAPAWRSAACPQSPQSPWPWATRSRTSAAGPSRGAHPAAGESAACKADFFRLQIARRSKLRQLCRSQRGSSQQCRHRQPLHLMPGVLCSPCTTGCSCSLVYIWLESITLLGIICTDTQHARVAELSHLGRPVGDIPRLLFGSILLVPAQLPETGLQVEQALVDGLALLHALPCVACSVCALVACQVHKGQPAPG